MQQLLALRTARRLACPTAFTIFIVRKRHSLQMTARVTCGPRGLDALRDNG
jgi:hypothetical protein